MRRFLLVSVFAAVSVLAVACAAPPDGRPSDASPTGRHGAGTLAPSASPVAAAAGSPVVLLFGGDVMLGRGVAELEPWSLFEGVRQVVAGADLAVANLEAPLTARPHLVGENALEAEPSWVALLAQAGFDALGVANNHAGKQPDRPSWQGVLFPG